MKIDKEKCIGCGTCVAICPVGAISLDADGKAVIQDAIFLQTNRIIQQR